MELSHLPQSKEQERPVVQRLVPRSHRQRGKASSSSFSPWVSYSGLDAVVITMMGPQRHRQLMRGWGFSLETWATSESRGFLIYGSITEFGGS